MARYVDGFVFPVPSKNIAAYKKMAKEGSKVWKKFGALDYYECMGDDLKVKASQGMGKQRSFVEMAKAKKGETVWFSFIIFKSKKHRDLVNKNVMDYLAKKYTSKKDMTMPFDVTKMAYGGFDAVIKS